MHSCLLARTTLFAVVLALGACGSAAGGSQADQGPEGVDLSYNADAWYPFSPGVATESVRVDTYPNGWVRLMLATMANGNTVQSSRERFSIVGAKAIEIARQRNHAYIAIITIEQVAMEELVPIGGGQYAPTDRLKMIVGQLLMATGDRGGRGWTPVDQFEAVLRDKVSTVPVTTADNHPARRSVLTDRSGPALVLPRRGK